MNETGEFEGSYDDGQGWSFAWKAAWHTGEYVIGQPGTEIVSLNVFHGQWDSSGELPGPDEIQPAVMLTRDHSAAKTRFSIIIRFLQRLKIRIERRYPVLLATPIIDDWRPTVSRVPVH
jgi:hypothetical protein